MNRAGDGTGAQWQTRRNAISATSPSGQKSENRHAIGGGDVHVAIRHGWRRKSYAGTEMIPAGSCLIAVVQLSEIGRIEGVQNIRPSLTAQTIAFVNWPPR